ncbi:unnamed protein product [Mytilus coruscus]|uniref:Uncharacterized protein n=1 Tax=Mytilus coruscus TaxID=42192 RepID=A0A6J8DWW5_MYTCO|nr:unnamed protein product [Mytilus coruscus]
MSKEGNKEDMEALKIELDEVKKHLATVIAKEKSAMEPKVVFTPRERKLTKFSGQKDGEQTVEEFIDEVELLLRTRPTSKKKQPPVQDADASFTVKPKNIKVERDIPDISIFAEQATSNTLELTKAVADLTQEVSNLKVEINNLKSSGDTRQGTKTTTKMLQLQ